MGWYLCFALDDLQRIFSCHRQWNMGVKHLCRRHLDLFMFIELYGYCLQQWNIASICRATYYLGNSPGCLEMSMGTFNQQLHRMSPSQGTGKPICEERQTAVVLSPSLFGGFIRITSICHREVPLYKVSIPSLICPSILTDPPLIPSLNPIPLPLFPTAPFQSFHKIYSISLSQGDLCVLLVNNAPCRLSLLPKYAMHTYPSLRTQLQPQTPIYMRLYKYFSVGSGKTFSSP